MTGVADLPLHKGKVPPWMLKLMERMSLAIIRTLNELYGPKAIIKGLSDPIWFQAFNNIIGMDWDSSGSTTVLTGILKSITWRNPEIGIIVLGGKGKRARDIPREVEKVVKIYDIDPHEITNFSRLAARVDSSFLQDGYELYHHSVIVSKEGDMLVIQQGMNLNNKMARRYHIDKFSVEEPHSGIAGVEGRQVLNATARESRAARKAYIDIISEGPKRILNMLVEVNRMLKGTPSLKEFLYYEKNKKETRLRSKTAYYRPLIPSPQLRRALENLTNFSPSNEIELALAPGLGPKVIRALALIADLIFNVPTSSRDPVTHPIDPFVYAYAIGGKDGVPYRYDAKTAMRTILTLEEALEYAKLGNNEKLRAIMRLRRLLEGLRYL